MHQVCGNCNCVVARIKKCSYLLTMARSRAASQQLNKRDRTAHKVLAHRRHLDTCSLHLCLDLWPSFHPCLPPPPSSSYACLATPLAKQWMVEHLSVLLLQSTVVSVVS
jgi:hypothetical protein